MFSFSYQPCSPKSWFTAVLIPFYCRNISKTNLTSKLFSLVKTRKHFGSLVKLMRQIRMWIMLPFMVSCRSYPSAFAETWTGNGRSQRVIRWKITKESILLKPQMCVLLSQEDVQDSTHRSQISQKPNTWGFGVIYSHDSAIFAPLFISSDSPPLAVLWLSCGNHSCVASYCSYRLRYLS